jgi:hypothetical protein
MGLRAYVVAGPDARCDRVAAEAPYLRDGATGGPPAEDRHADTRGPPCP